MVDSEPILVAIYCMVYNHEPYLRKCFDGFVMQETSFRFVAVVHDDCSGDGSVEIIREYVARYPDLFIPIYETENQYSKYNGSIERIMNKTIRMTRCKYVAFCEGDDYWIDSHKLQNQVDFLESHVDYSVTFHRWRQFNMKTGEMQDDNCGFLFANGERGRDVDLELCFKYWVTQPLTMVYRATCWKVEEMLRYRYYRDMHQIYHLLKKGKGYLFAFVGGVRTIHGGGVASMISQKRYCDISLPMDREFYWKTLDRGPRKFYLETLEECVRIYAGENKWKALRCALSYCIISRHPRSLIRHMKLILGNG